MGIAAETWAFTRKQASACLFAILMLGLIAGTAAVWPPDAALARYDAIFLGALAIQAALLASGMETWEEARVILVYHIVGTAMELFKTHIGSWTYPEESFFRIAGVPLFSGFMYAAIGSYIARTWRLFDLRFTRYPARGWTYALSVAIYVNFIAHHYWIDLRAGLFLAAAVLWGRTWVYGTLAERRVGVPLLALFGLIAVLIWVAENVGTYSGTWLYPHQFGGWQLVSPAKIGAWFLLMLLSWVLVSAVRRPEPPGA